MKATGGLRKRTSPSPLSLAAALRPPEFDARVPFALSGATTTDDTRAKIPIRLSRRQLNSWIPLTIQAILPLLARDSAGAPLYETPAMLSHPLAVVAVAAASFAFNDFDAVRPEMFRTVS